MHGGVSIPQRKHTGNFAQVLSVRMQASFIETSDVARPTAFDMETCPMQLMQNRAPNVVMTSWRRRAIRRIQAWSGAHSDTGTSKPLDLDNSS